MPDNRSPLETFFELLVLLAVGAQTWLVVNEATDGEAGRTVARWWASKIRPQVVRVVMWLDAKAIMERTIVEEISPFLSEDPS